MMQNVVNELGKKLAKRFFNGSFIVLLLMSLSACQTTSSHIQPASIKRLLLTDTELAKVDLQVATSPLETPSDIFALDEAAREFVAEIVANTKTQSEQMRALNRALFSRTSLDLAYASQANTVASDTFARREANCLSLTILAFAMSEHAGFKTQMQRVLVPEFWTVNDGRALLNGHVNLKIQPRKQSSAVTLFPEGIIVDFDPQPNLDRLPTQKLSKKAITALFYNNRGAEFLLVADYARAYQYFSTALLFAPKDASTVSNLGYLYRILGLWDKAENAYLYALSLDENKLTILENLARLYDYQGKVEAAQKLRVEVQQKRLRNPYYHMLLGQQAQYAQDWSSSIEHFTKAIKLKPDFDLFYLGLATGYAELGQWAKSKRSLKKARRFANTERRQETYANKLSVFNSIKNSLNY